MQNFHFHNPTEIFFGDNSLENLSPSIQSDKILLLYGSGSIKKNGTYEKVIKNLAGKNIIEFPGITPNPEFEQAMQAVKLVKEQDIQFILAVGGGSVIDCAKFIAIAARYHSDEPKMLFNGEEAAKVNPIPFGVVLTLPATGSEMNSGAVITVDGLKLGVFNDQNFPKFSILDPNLTLSLTPHYIGNGIVDAYVHVLEQYLTFPQNAPLQDRMAESILTTLLEEGPKTYNDPKDYNARANLMWCASMALNSLISVGVESDWSTHGIGHQLTSLYNIDHGRTLALVWAKNMRQRKANKMEKMIQYATRVLKLTESDQDILFEAALNKTNDFFNSVGVPTEYSAYPQIGSDLPFKMVSRMKQLKMTTLGEKGDLSMMQVMNILK
tara:strand:+ start:6921 stop:8066 length:1146 start_codon:yes stop_codon:yes gene_type:complete